MVLLHLYDFILNYTKKKILRKKKNTEDFTKTVILKRTT